MALVVEVAGPRFSVRPDRVDGGVDGGGGKMRPFVGALDARVRGVFGFEILPVGGGFEVGDPVGYDFFLRRGQEGVL